jgi:hypothetical protein
MEFTGISMLHRKFSGEPFGLFIINSKQTCIHYTKLEDACKSEGASEDSKL